MWSPSGLSAIPDGVTGAGAGPGTVGDAVSVPSGPVRNGVMPAVPQLLT